MGVDRCICITGSHSVKLGDGVGVSWFIIGKKRMVWQSWPMRLLIYSLDRLLVPHVFCMEQCGHPQLVSKVCQPLVEQLGHKSS